MSGAARGVVITGGAAGIGWATARRFAAEGYRVAILDRDNVATARAAELGGGHIALQVDVADEAALVRAIDAAHAAFGRLDVLVANAGVISGCAAPTFDLDIADVRRMLAINVGGVRVAAQRAAGIMRAQGGGAIVNVASLAGFVAVPTRTAYSASKAAVIGLTRAFAQDLAGSGVRINAVLPGFTATETLRTMQRRRATDSSKVERRIPLGRLAEPEEIAAAIHHLAAPDTGATTGLLLTVDGGFRAYGGIDDASTGGAFRPEMRTEPRVAVIVRATGPIGTATALRLAAHGTRVVLSGPDRAALHALADRLPSDSAVIVADASGQASADAAIAAALSYFGRLDLLIDARGSSSDPFDDGLAGSVILARAAASAMLKQGGGAIVNLASATPSALSAALAMLTRSLACEWAAHGIRANIVLADPASPSEDATRLTRIAAAIDFLGSDDASYITGIEYPVG